MHRYETDYGIFNHDADSDPMSMALMRMHPAEDPFFNSRLFERMEMFEKYEVPQRFGISWTEFIKMPRHECDKMLELCKTGQAERGKAAQTIADELARTGLNK